MPGLRGALSVRVNDGVSDRVVTRYCRGLKFTKVAPGGHRDLSFTMNLPRNTFTDLGPADRVYVYDARTGRTIIEGYLENPTPVDGPDGQQFAVSAMGGMALASDETRGLIYITRELDGWETDAASYAGATHDAITNGTNVGERIQFPGGSVVALFALGAIRNGVVARAGMNLGAIQVDTFGGKADGNWGPAVSTDSGYGAYVGAGLSGTLSTAHLVTTKWVGTDFTNSTVAGLFLQRVAGGAVNVADDTTWAHFDNIVLLGQRMNRNGTLLTGAAGLVSATQVLASQVVEDLLGRLLTFCDPATARIDTTTYGITQLAWPDGVKAADVMTALSVFEADYLWEILETLDNGKHRFNYRGWPTTPRYEVSVRDNWVQRGSDVDLCNRILVTWTDAAGSTRVTTVTTVSLDPSLLGPLEQLGTRIKDADPIALPAGFGSEANAIRIGLQILTDKINPPRAGTILVRRPILDQLTGNTVMPWEIEAGYLCRVRELGEDLRIAQVDYDDDSCSSLLTLGTPVLTIEQRIAQLARRTTGSGGLTL